jgi:transposase
MARNKHQKTLKIVHNDCADIDIGSREHWVGVDPYRCETLSA